MADSDNESGGPNNHSGESSTREQDRFLPIANVSRIMKKALPANAKISKDAKETVQECVSEFISFITGEASDKCQREKRKTVNGDDLIWAMTTLGFEDYVEPLKLYLQKYRELEGEKVSPTVSQKDGGGGATSSAGGDHPGGIGSGMYGGSMMMMMGQPVYASHTMNSSPTMPNSPSYRHHMAMAAKNSLGGGGAGSGRGGGGNSASSAGNGRAR